MKLLILTQKVDINDDVLGFFHGWIAEFAKNCEQVTVICLFKGDYDLPNNVKVLSLGKEEFNQKSVKSKVYKVKSQLIYLFRFYKYIWQERKNYDNVFVHMNQIYVILGGLFWRMWHKKIALWYTHKQVTCSLRIAEKLVDTIFTASKESFRLKTKKLKVMGHGIYTDIFKPAENKKPNDKFKILTVGRISPIKDLKTIVKAIAELKDKNIELEVVGKAGTEEQERYFEEVKNLVKERGIENKVKFIGSVPNRDVLKYYQEADLFVNASNTGSLDKAGLEAMSCGCLLLTSNDALVEIVKKFSDKLIFIHKDHKILSGRIDEIMSLNFEKRVDIGLELRKVVDDNHNLSNLILKILDAKTS